MKLFKDNETQLKSSWILKDGSLVAGSIGERITDLITNSLEKVSQSNDGWSSLYVDSNDGRYWELTYPDSESHGGGVPVLSLLAQDQINQNYDVS